MLLVDYIFKQVVLEGFIQKRLKKEGGERVSYIDIWEESILGRRNKYKDFEMCLVIVIQKRVLVVDVCVCVCIMMRNIGFFFR